MNRQRSVSLDAHVKFDPSNPPTFTLPNQQPKPSKKSDDEKHTEPIRDSLQTLVDPTYTP
ncbi:hypothetical protein HK097_010375, partial [Rhizophlyctis rosea]